MLLILTIFSFFIDLVSVEMYVLENTDNSASVNISRHVDMLNSLTTLTISKRIKYFSNDDVYEICMLKLAIN